MPFVKGEISELATFAVVCNLAWHADLDGFVWVSDRTQEREIPPHRSTIWSIRRLLISEGWLKYTGQRKQKGVKVYKLVIPNYLPSGLAVQTTKETSGLDSGLTSGLGSGLTSGLLSGLPSGSTSGSFCGLPYPTKYEIKTNENIEIENNNFQENKHDIPENVRERINQSKRSKGIRTDNSETSLGEAIKSVFDNMQKPDTNQNEEPF